MIGVFTYCIRRLRLAVTCEICGGDVGQDGRPYYFSSERGSPTRHLCSTCRHGHPASELAQHLDDRWRELIAAGASSDEATRLTLADFRAGDVIAR